MWPIERNIAEMGTPKLRGCACRLQDKLRAHNPFHRHHSAGWWVGLYRAAAEVVLSN